MNTNTCSCLGMADGGRWGPIKVLGWVRGQGPHRDDIMRWGEERHAQAVRWWMLNNGTHRGIQECFCTAGRSRSAIWIGAVWRLWEKQREFLHRGLERPPLQSALCATFPNISTNRKREREIALLKTDYWWTTYQYLDDLESSLFLLPWRAEREDRKS